MKKQTPKELRQIAINKVKEGIFVDLNEPGFKKLFHSNIKPLQDVYGMKFYSHRDYAALTTDEKETYLKFLADVMTGERVKEMYNTAGDNYIQGIEHVLGDDELSNDFQRVMDKIGDNKNLLKQFFNELPSLNLFYKRSKKDGTTEGHQLSAEDIDEQRSDIYDVVDKWIEKVNA